MQDAKRVQIRGRGVVVRGNDIDTDRIIPARFLKCITYDSLGHHAFADDRELCRMGGKIHPFDQPAFAEAEILVVNKNFGCGSSREHAGQALKRWNKGIKAIIGESFAEIFFGNCLANGIPCISADTSDIEKLMALCESDPTVTIELNLDVMNAKWKGHTIMLSMPEGARKALVDGRWDATQDLVSHVDEVRALADKLPYSRFQQTYS